MYTSHQRPSCSYPHHTRCPQHTNTPTPITPDALVTLTHLPPSHQMPSAHKHTYPHHTRCLQHTNTPTPITPDAFSTQTHLPPLHQMPSAHKHTYPHHTRCPQHTNTPTPTTPNALMGTPDTLQLPTLHQISTLSMHPQLPHITPDALSTQPQLPT